MKGLLTSILIIGSATLFAQNIHFIKTYGNSGYDYGEDIIQTPDTGYIATGSSSSFGTGTADAFLLKVDSLGNFQWSYSYGGPGSEWGEKVRMTLDSGFAICGYTNSFGAGGFDFYAIKTDKYGVPEWEKTFGGTDWDMGRSLAVLPDSGYVFVGETHSFGSGNRDVYIVRVDKNGDTLWTRTYGGPEDDYANDVAFDGDSIVVVGGTNSFGPGMTDGLILKLHLDGTIGKERYIGGWDNDYFTSIVAKDTFYLLGGTRNYHHDVGCGAACGQDFWIYKIVNNIDTVLADTTRKGPDALGEDIVYDVTISPTNNTFYGGTTTSWGYPDVTEGYTDAFLGKHLNNYYSVWDYVSNFGEVKDDIVNGLDYCYDDGIVGVGSMFVMSTGGYNVFIVRVDKPNSWPNISVWDDLETEVITLSINPDKLAPNLIIFPIPSQDLVYIDGLDEVFNASVFSLSGELMQTYANSPEFIDISTLNTGFYILELQTESSRIIRKISKQ